MATFYQATQASEYRNTVVAERRQGIRRPKVVLFALLPIFFTMHFLESFFG